MVVHIYDPNTQKAEAENLDFNLTLGYTWNLVSWNKNLKIDRAIWEVIKSPEVCFHKWNGCPIHIVRTQEGNTIFYSESEPFSDI